MKTETAHPAHPAISIIVPVYNVKPYLDRCVSSVQAQTFTDWELLLIDDGSTDGSGEICDACAQREPRVRVMHQPNGGVSAARNRGLDEARGEYMMFLDADDYYIDGKTLETLYRCAEAERLDWLRGEYVAVDEEGGVLLPLSLAEVNGRRRYAGKVLDADDFLCHVIRGEFFSVLVLFRRKCLDACRFERGRMFLEDMRFLLNALRQDGRYAYMNLPFYAYRKRGGGVSGQADVRKLRDSFDMCDWLASWADRLPSGGRQAWGRYNSVMMYYWTLQTLAAAPFYAERESIATGLRLASLQRRTLRRLGRYRVFNLYLPFFVLPVGWGCKLMRLKDCVTIWLHGLSRKPWNTQL